LGYTKIVQYGAFTDVYNYELNVKKKVQSLANSNQRSGNRRRAGKTHYRSIASVKRAKQTFFTLVQANLSRKGPPVFITHTYIEEKSITIAYEHLRIFFQNLKRYFAINAAYISVPEWQKNGNIHLHSLVWNYPETMAKKERITRIAQRCWARGFVDVRVAKNNDGAIAGYLAKYMAKTYSDERLNNRRAFTHSNNIEKRHISGSNTMSSYLSDILPDNCSVVNVADYDTMYLGKCYKYTYLDNEKAYNSNKRIIRSTQDWNSDKNWETV